MNEVRTAIPDGPATTPDEAFDELERLATRDDPSAAIARLVGGLQSPDRSRALLEALLLSARHELGLPAVAPRALAEIPEPARTRYEERYVEALREVGRRLLEAGDIPSAWPYFRVLGERDEVARAIDEFVPNEGGDERVGPLIDIAFHQGVNPERGFEFLMGAYGICSAITAFEHLPPDERIRSTCAERLTAGLREQLAYSLRSEIERRGEPSPPEGAGILDLIDGRAWLFEDDAYHVDTSHLSSIVRLAPILRNDEAVGQALELAEYGRRLSDRYQYVGEPPFEDLYGDHATFLNALRGVDADRAIEELRSKLTPPDPDGDSPMATMPAQVLVLLLRKLGRAEEAIQVAMDHLGNLPDGMLLCPGTTQLCVESGRLDLLAEHARRTDNLPLFLAAVIQGRRNRPV